MRNHEVVTIYVLEVFKVNQKELVQKINNDVLEYFVVKVEVNLKVY